MKWNRIAALVAASALSVATLTMVTSQAEAREKCVIANSHYTGWEPIWLARDLGILKKWGDKYGVDLGVTDPMDYAESINQFAAGQFCALAVTNMDALTGPAASGIKTTFVTIGDYSDGNDGIIAKSRNHLAPKDLVGQKVTLVQGTVSQYLLWRAAQLKGFDYGKVTIVNASSESDVKNAFATMGSFVVTWNPILLAGLQEKHAQMLVSSHEIPGEIIDGIAFNNALASENARKAIAGAWHEVLGIMNDVGSPRRTDAIKRMAAFAGNTVEELEAQLRTTHLFYTPADAVKFTTDAKLKKTMDLVRQFAAENGLLKNGAGVEQNADYVGIKFPDGTIVGDKNNVTLIFDTTYMDLAAAGKL